MAEKFVTMSYYLVEEDEDYPLAENEHRVFELEAGEIILNSEECKILYSELSHHTCSRDHYHEFHKIIRKIAKSSQESIIEAAKDNLVKDKD